ncbi:Putative uncharacterized protein [Lactobacillus delbrueckii subsp. lactis]|nr:Putative uncharacterized protein [Lactobacillus delbrueckii subsp. lactis]
MNLNLTVFSVAVHEQRILFFDNVTRMVEYFSVNFFKLLISLFSIVEVTCRYPFPAYQQFIFNQHSFNPRQIFSNWNFLQFFRGIPYIEVRGVNGCFCWAIYVIDVDFFQIF